jgi:hypothetical protein
MLLGSLLDSTCLNVKANRQLPEALITSTNRYIKKNKMGYLHRKQSNIYIKQMNNT